MIETLNRPEAEQSAEYNEQTPEQFIESLTLFDEYKPVPENAEPTPEQQMPFTKEEQEIAAGIRGTLEELARNADESESYVSISEMFTELEATIRDSDATEEMKDQLFLVATKMRYHLQLRYDKAQQGEPAAEKVPAASSLFEAAVKGGAFYKSYIDTQFKNLDDKYRFADTSAWESVRDARDAAQTRDSEWDQWVNERQEQLGDEGLDAKPENNPRDYQAEARGVVDTYTNGNNYKDLDTKTQGKVNRQIARDYHPDRGGDEELYKAITAETDIRNNSADTESY